MMRLFLMKMTFRVYNITMLVVLAALILCSFDYGITWDEGFRTQEAYRLVQYYKALWSSEALPRFTGNYGMLHDVTGYLLQFISPLHFPQTRHVVTVIVGWLGVYFTGKFAYRYWGAMPALFAVFILLASPRYFGSLSNNPKDIPFATAYIIAFYYLAKLSRSDLVHGYRNVLKLAGAISLLISYRAYGGFVFFGYAFLYFSYLIFSGAFTKELMIGALIRFILLVNCAVLFAFIFVPQMQVGYLLYVLPSSAAMISLLAIIKNFRFANSFLSLFRNLPAWLKYSAVAVMVLSITGLIFHYEWFGGIWNSLLRITRYKWQGAILYNGEYIRPLAGLSPGYLFNWFFMTTPIPVLIFLLCSLAPLVTGSKHRRLLLMLWGIVVFPVSVVLINHSTLYNANRHFFFIYPPMVLLAVYGSMYIVSKLKSDRTYTSVFAILIAVLFFDPIRFSFANHPNQYVYFNQLKGGIASAYGNYELDYWGNCFKESLDWIEDVTSNSDRVIDVRALPGGPSHVVEYRILYEKKKNFNYVRQYSQSTHFDLALVIGPVARYQKMMASPRFIHMISADGVPLCLILKGKDYESLGLSL